MRQRKQKSLSTCLVLWPINICQLQESNSWLSLVSPFHWDFHPLAGLTASSQLLPLPQPRPAGGPTPGRGPQRQGKSFKMIHSCCPTGRCAGQEEMSNICCTLYTQCPAPNSCHTAAFKWEKDTTVCVHGHCQPQEWHTTLSRTPSQDSILIPPQQHLAGDCGSKRCHSLLGSIYLSVSWSLSQRIRGRGGREGTLTPLREEHTLLLGVPPFLVLLTQIDYRVEGVIVGLSVATSWQAL